MIFVYIIFFLLWAFLMASSFTCYGRLEGLSSHVRSIIYGVDIDKLRKLDINATYDNLKFWKFWDYNFDKMVVYKD